MGIQARITHGITQVMSLNMLMWLTMLTLFAAILFLAGAVYMALAAVLTPALASLLTGVSLLVLCALLIIVIRIATRAPARQSQQKPAESHTAPSATHTAVNNGEAHSAGDRTQRWVQNNPGIAIAGATAMGIALTASPRLRHFILRTTAPAVSQFAKRAAEGFTQR